MAEDCYFIKKDMFMIKIPNKSRIVLKMIVPAVVIIYSIYICYVCLNQTEPSKVQDNPNFIARRDKPKFIARRDKSILVRVTLVEEPCHHPVIPLFEVPFVHYPEPKTNGRNECSNKTKPSKVQDKPKFISRQDNPKLIPRQDKAKLVGVKLVEEPCHRPVIPLSEAPFVHYPEPKTYSRNECSCTPVRFFVVVSMQRSGSMWLTTLLNSHANISSYGEIFYGSERRGNMSAITRTLDEMYNLDWHSSFASKKDCTAAVGFKWMLNQGLMEHYDEIAEYFTRRGVSVIFLFRRNQLRRRISHLANAHNGNAKQLNEIQKAHVQSKIEAEILATYKPKLGVKRLVYKLKQSDERAAEALKYLNSTRHIVLYYEDLVQNQTKLADVMEFLRVPLRKLVSRQVKIHTKPLSALVSNWDAVRTALKGTQYERFLIPDY